MSVLLDTNTQAVNLQSQQDPNHSNLPENQHKDSLILL